MVFLSRKVGVGLILRPEIGSILIQVWTKTHIIILKSRLNIYFVSSPGWKCHGSFCHHFAPESVWHRFFFQNVFYNGLKQKCASSPSIEIIWDKSKFLFLCSGNIICLFPLQPRGHPIFPLYFCTSVISYVLTFVSVLLNQLVSTKCQETHIQWLLPHKKKIEFYCYKVMQLTNWKIMKLFFFPSLYLVCLILMLCILYSMLITRSILNFGDVTFTFLELYSIQMKNNAVFFVSVIQPSPFLFITSSWTFIMKLIGLRMPIRSWVFDSVWYA